MRNWILAAAILGLVIATCALSNRDMPRAGGEAPVAGTTSRSSRPAFARTISTDLIDYLLVSRRVVQEPLPVGHPFRGRRFEMIDLRSPTEFAAGHIPFSRNVPHETLFDEIRIGPLSRLERSCVLVLYAQVDPTEDVSHAASEAGFPDVYLLSGGFQAWAAQGLRQASLPVTALAQAPPTPPVVLEPTVTATELHESLRGPNPPMVVFVSPMRDIYENGHIPGAEHVPLDTVKDRFGKVPRDTPVVFYCGCCRGTSNGLSGTAVGYLREMGFKDVKHLLGHLEAWQVARYELETGGE